MNKLPSQITLNSSITNESNKCGILRLSLQVISSMKQIKDSIYEYVIKTPMHLGLI